MFWSFSLTVPYAILLADVNHSKREGSNDGTKQTLLVRER